MTFYIRKVKRNQNCIVIDATLVGVRTLHIGIQTESVSGRFRVTLQYLPVRSGNPIRNVSDLYLK